MLVVLSPSKKLDTSPVSPAFVTEPAFAEDAYQLVGVLQGMSAGDIGELMGLSDKLSTLNYERYQDFFDAATTPAFFTFDGDTYVHIPRDTYTEMELTSAQARIRILSGLFGVLRPMDLIQPYRLEMGTKLENERGRDLYAFWGSSIATQLRADLETLGSQVLVNLASKEYFKSVDLDALGARVIEPIFRDYKNGKYKVIAFYAKRARGMMADFIIRHDISRPEDLTEFNVAGYAYDEASSTPDRPVFLRNNES